MASLETQHGSEQGGEAGTRERDEVLDCSREAAIINLLRLDSRMQAIWRGGNIGGLDLD